MFGSIELILVSLIKIIVPSKSSLIPSEATMGSADAPLKAFSHLPQQQQTFKPPLIANENAFLGDVISSEKNDPKAPISAGFYRLEKGTPLVYEYTYDEMKIILEGSFDISDETGQKVHATKGDVFYFPKGSKITFTTEDYGLGFYTGQRKEGAA